MNRKHLLAAALLMAWGSAASGQNVKAGIEAWQRSDYPGAVRVWRPLAEKGDADAQFNLGQAYRLGRGVPTNLSAAKTWFERAARQGHVDAQTTLGLMLFQNGEQAEGIKWLKLAAEKGEPRAQLVYGTALVNGDGVTQDPALGYAFVSRAAGQGLQPAKETLAQLDRILSPADRKKASAAAGSKSKSATVALSAAPQRQAAQPRPAPSAASTSATAAALTGNWRIQLGAFSQRGGAEALYRKVSAKPALAGRRAFYIPVGALTRLQVGPFGTKAQAQAACNAAGVPCFAVPAK